jgi:hypothetical protein
MNIPTLPKLSQVLSGSTELYPIETGEEALSLRTKELEGSKLKLVIAFNWAQLIFPFSKHKEISRTKLRGLGEEVGARAVLSLQLWTDSSST